MVFSKKLVDWYKVNKRDLPWRDISNAYRIWISEIILQQTKVSQGLPYYLKFIDTFPNVADLANANLDNVMKIWQGLGYYSRARNMHTTAKIIVNDYNGEFPNDYTQILALPGIGPYTAAAISSFAFNLPHAVVDGNVVRVLSRVFGLNLDFYSKIGKEKFYELADKCLIKNNPSLYNSAIMDFGSIQCLYKSPNCYNCPMQDFCFAFNKNLINKLPKKSKKVKKKIKFINFLVIDFNDRVAVLKKNSGIWKDMYEFPSIETKKEVDLDSLTNSDNWKSIFKYRDFEILNVSKTYTHQLTHQKIIAKFWHISSKSDLKKNLDFVKKSNLNSLPMSRLMEKFLESNYLK